MFSSCVSVESITYRTPAIITHSCILTIHKARILRKKPLEKTFLDIKKWVKIIQTAGYNGASTVVSCTRLNKIYWNLSKKYWKSDWSFKKVDSVWQNTQWNQLSNAHAGCDHQTNSKLGTEHFWWFIWVNSDSNRRHNVDKVFRFFEFAFEIVNSILFSSLNTNFTNSKFQFPGFMVLQIFFYI